MSRIVTKIAGSLAAVALFVGSTVSALAGEADQGVAMFNSSKMWAPFQYNNDLIFYADPQSVYKVSDYEWDVNLSAVNNSNQYVPLETKTYRINCQNLKILPNIGWRINGILTENKGPLGLRSTKDSRFEAKSGQVVWTAKEYVCGVSNSGSTYYWAYSYFRNNQIRGPIDQIWFKENVVEISQDDQNLRRTHLMLSVLGGDQPNFTDWFVKCDKREYMEAANGVTTTDWSPIPAASGIEVLFEKMCSNRFSYITYQTVPITLPAPKPAPEPSPDANVQPPASSDIDDAKKKCADLGFVRGTPKFGQCVLKVSE